LLPKTQTTIHDVRLSGLWASRSFTLLWTGQTASQLGSQVTLVALPLTAILVLNATPLEVGLLTATGFLPAALFGLLAGVLVDRVRRRPLQIGCQFVLAATTISVPIASWLGILRLEQLFALQAINGALTVVSSAAGQAYLPRLVKPPQLTEANAKLTTGSAVARIVGPGFGGALVQIASAPMAMVVDAVSFAFCAVCLLLIRTPEQPFNRTARRSLFSDIQEGLYLVIKHPLIRPMFLSGGAYNFFAAIFVAVYTLFMVRELGVAATNVGIIVACGGAGGVLGGVVADRFAQRFGMGRAIICGMLLLAVMHVVAPLAFGPSVVIVPLLGGAAAFAQLGLAVMTVNRTTLIQQIVPAHAQGRVAATQQVVVLAAVPIGAALGGVLGDTLGLRGTVGLAAVGTILATVPMLRSRLWTIDTAASAIVVDEATATTTEPPAGALARLWRFHTAPGRSALP
jgi:MFS family permease